MPSAQELFAKIAEKSLVDVDALPKKARIVWFPKMNAMEVSLLYPLTENGSKGDAKRQEMIQSVYPTTWLRGEASPFNPDMLILEMFEDAIEYRVYAAPKADAKPRAGKPLAPTVYRLNKSAALMSQDAMSYDMLVDLIANEWAMVDEGIATRDRERALVLEYIESLPADYSVKELAEDLTDERHYEDEDDDEEEEEEEAEGEGTSEGKDKDVGLAAAPPPPPPAAVQPLAPPATSAAASETLSE